MNENMKVHASDRHGFQDDEDSRLEMALHDPDRLLTESLRVDERRRRARRIVSVTLLIGGILMGTTLMAMLAGWLTLAAAAADESGPPDDALQKLAPGRIVDVRPITKDCMVLAYLTEWNHGDVDNVAVANNDGGVRALFAWRSVPVELLTPQGRRAYLAVYSRETTSGPAGGEIVVQPVAENWPEKTSWRAQPKIEESADMVTSKFTEGDGWKFFDITALLTDQRAKNGVILRFADEGRSGTPGQWSGFAIVSREGEGEWKNRHPQLLIVDATKSTVQPK